MDAVDFGALYERYSRDVLRFATFLTGSRTEAEDITSETFVRAWASAGAIRVSTVKAYLFMIARNLHVDGLREQARRATAPEDRVDPSPGHDAVLDRRDELARVLAALQTLPEIDRAALLMRADDELPYEDIAAALGLSVASARVKVHRARLRLAELRTMQEGQ
jgi:RNA polymerase sigma-70 factor, ECF subfamily